MRYATDSDPTPRPRRGAITTAAQAATALDSAVAVLASKTAAPYRITGLRSFNDRLAQVTLVYDADGGPAMITTARDDPGSMLTVGLKARLCQAVLDLDLEQDPHTDPAVLATRGRDLITTATMTPAELVVNDEPLRGASLTTVSARAIGCELDNCTIVLAWPAAAGLADRSVGLVHSAA